MKVRTTVKKWAVVEDLSPTHPLTHLFSDSLPTLMISQPADVALGVDSVSTQWLLG